MANRVPAWISIGGTVPAAIYPDLVDHITAEALSLEWDGVPFEAGDRVEGVALKLHAHEVAGGQLEAMEAWLVDQDQPFVRRCGGYDSEWNPEIVVFTGSGDPVSYTADEQERVLVDRETVDRLGTIEAVRAYLDAADFTVPPLVVVGENSAVDRSAA